MRRLSIILLFLTLSILLSACVEEITPEKVSSDVSSSTIAAESSTQSAEIESTQPASVTETFKIGDVVKAGEAQFTVNSVREDNGNEFMKPKDGNVYYVVDVTVENKGSESLAVSSLMMFKLVDSEGYSQDITVGPETKGSVDGEVSPGRKLRGELAFEISKEAKGLELEIDPSLWGTGKVIVELDR